MDAFTASIGRIGFSLTSFRLTAATTVTANDSIQQTENCSVDFLFLFLTFFVIQLDCRIGHNYNAIAGANVRRSEAATVRNAFM